MDLKKKSMISYGLFLMTAGGGLASEGEMIEVVEWSLEDARKYLGRKEVNSPGSFMFGLMWALNRIG